MNLHPRLLLCLLFTTFGVHQTATAQFLADAEERNFVGSFMVGANLSQVDGDLYAGVYKVGLVVGPQVMVHIKGRSWIHVGLQFAQKGSLYHKEVNTGVGPSFLKYQLHTNNVEIPIVWNYNVAPRWNVGIGAIYNRWLNSKEYYEGINGRLDLESDVYPFEKNAVDGMIQGQFQLNNHWMFQLSYQYSITPIRKQWNTHQDFSNSDQKNNLFSVKIGYVF